jgi:hypothetical protein
MKRSSLSPTSVATWKEELEAMAMKLMDEARKRKCVCKAISKFRAVGSVMIYGITYTKLKRDI